MSRKGNIAAPPTPGPSSRAKLRKMLPMLFTGACTVVAAVIAVVGALLNEGTVADRGELRENVRLIQEAHGEVTSERRFAGWGLEGADLRGLDLGCSNLRPAAGAPVVLASMEYAQGCADFRFADLRRADMRHMELGGGRFAGADMRGAVLRNALLPMASFSDHTAGADLSGAVLDGANLQGADLSQAILADVSMEGVCWDESTRWPVGFEPPSSRCLVWFLPGTTEEMLSLTPRRVHEG